MKENSHKVLEAAIRSTGEAAFRGGAVDNLEKAPMGKGHGNNGQPFDINTACYLKPIFAAYDDAVKNRRRLFMVIKSGVKTMKSFALEVCAAEHVCNRSGDAAIFFGSETAAEGTATTRILDFFKRVPRFKRKLELLRRHDETIGAVRFPDKTLFIQSANLGNTQQKNLAFVGLQDAFVTTSSGMIDEMLARTTQYEREAIIILESQGGEKGFDFDRKYEDTNQQELHVRCPLCKAAHLFNWKAFDEPSMTRIDGTIAGFKRGSDELIKRPDGTYNEPAILAQTHFECFHCRGIWHDIPSTRAQLDSDESVHYVASNPFALPSSIGFNTPQWINRRLSWGKMMLEKLKAQKVANELGNFEPLKKWWQKVAARTWDSEINSKSVERPGITQYDASDKIPGEVCRISATDIQFKLTHMVYLAVAVGDGVPPRVLHAEWVKPPAGLNDYQSSEFCKNRVRELDKEFKIEQQNSMKDAAHEPGMVRDWAAEDAVFTKMRDGAGRIKNQWCAYGLLIGDDRSSYRWSHPGRKDTWERFKQFQWHKVPAIKDGKRVSVDVHHRLWSNPSIKDIAERWRDGTSAPRLEIHEKLLSDLSRDGFWSQLTSERKIPWRGHPGKLHYNNEGKPNHFWDCWCMCIVRMDELGLLNSFGAATPEEDGFSG